MKINSKNIIELIKSFFKLKTVHPRIGAGTLSFLIFIIFALSSRIEQITGFPLVSSEYIILVFLVCLIPVILLRKKFFEEYDPENNDNAKVFLFLMCLFIGFFALMVNLN